jgi:hypothetical protein
MVSWRLRRVAYLTGLPPSTFFDGVPDPHLVLAGRAAEHALTAQDAALGVEIVDG